MDEQRPKNNEARTTALEVEPQRKKLGPRRKFMQEMFGAHGGLPALAPDPTPRADRPDGCPSEPFPARDVRCRKACAGFPPPHPPLELLGTKSIFVGIEFSTICAFAASLLLSLTKTCVNQIQTSQILLFTISDPDTNLITDSDYQMPQGYHNLYKRQF